MSIELARSITSEILERKLRESKIFDVADDDGLARVIALSELVIGSKAELRFYMASSVGHVSPFWESIRENDIKTDFVFEMLNELKARYLDQVYTDFKAQNPGLTFDLSQGWHDLVEILSFSISKKHVDHFSENAVDDETHKRLPTTAETERLLDQNDWLVLLYLISTLDVLEDISNVQRTR